MNKKIFFLAIFSTMAIYCGCDAPLRCYDERIEVTMPATIEHNGMKESANLTGVVAPGNVGEEVFAALKSVLVANAGAQNFGFVWTVPAFNTNGGAVAIALQAPLRTGETLTINGSFQGGGWGRFDLPSGTRALASVRAENFTATSASGTIQILQIAPLILRIAVTATDTGNTSITLGGDASFRFARERVPCS